MVASPSPVLTIAQQQITPTASPSASTVDLSVYKLQVQNGSGISGEAGSVASTLSFEGFKNIDTANATSSAYVKTEVAMKKDTPRQVFDAINKALNSDYTITLSDIPISDTSAYDVIIIVGKKSSSS